MRILIADDHDLVRETVGAFLDREADLDCTLADTLPAALTRIARERFDLVLLDYVMPGMNGLEGLRRALKANGEGTVALFSGMAPNEVARDALAAGACGFVPKTAPARSLLAAVRFMLAGERYVPTELLAPERSAPTSSVHPLIASLTRRERETLDALSRGLSNKEIARDLAIAEVTVKLHVRTLCRKLDARNRTHAVVIANDLAAA